MIVCNKVEIFLDVILNCCYIVTLVGLYIIIFKYLNMKMGGKHAIKGFNL